MIEISLERLVAVPNTSPLWPDEFRSMVEKLEQNPADATGWLVLADWLQEKDERGLERAARWIAKRDGAGIHKEVAYGNTTWRGQFPAGLKSVWEQESVPADRSTLPGFLAALSKTMRKIDEEMA